LPVFFTAGSGAAGGAAGGGGSPLAASACGLEGSPVSPLPLPAGVWGSRGVHSVDAASAITAAAANRERISVLTGTP
jgi:hypothetical protein